jgi:hypothetical protein
MHVAVKVEVGMMPTIGGGGERILSIVEMSRNAELKNGVPEQARQWPYIKKGIALRKSRHPPIQDQV